jgi:hypothetical protein
VDDGPERPPITRWIKLPDKLRRCGPHDLQDALNRLQHTGDTAERQRRSQESDDFSIRATRVSSDDLNRIGGRVDTVVALVQQIETRFQTLTRH